MKVKKNNEQKRESKGSLLLKQLIAAVIGLVLVLSMKFIPIRVLNDCATSIGRALRFDPAWAETAQSAAAKVKDKIGHKNFSQQ